MILTLLLLSILFLVLLRVPVAFALLGPCLAYFVYNGQSIELALRTSVAAVNSFPLLAVPLFILLGFIANQAGIAERMFEFAGAILSPVRASLGYVNVGVSLGFSWMSGSALADAAGLGKVEVPAMIRRGYDPGFSVGVTASSALLGPVMPPSIPAIVYASIAAVSTGALFAAAVVPAFIMAVGLFLACYIWGRKQHHLAGVPFDGARIKTATVRVAGALGAPVIILGGILGGYFTPTEAAAVGALYMLLIGFAYRALRVRDLSTVLRGTVLTTASITIILAASALLGQIMAREQVPQNVALLLTDVTDSPVVFLLLVNAVLIMLGMIIEPTAVLVITVPILLPVAATFGVDPLHFGVIAILNLMIGLLTPPLGAVLYVLSSATGISVEKVFRGTAPFLIPLFATLMIITFLPDVVLFLPRALGLLE